MKDFHVQYDRCLLGKNIDARKVFDLLNISKYSEYVY